MPFNLKNIVPWGRSLDEYIRMFALTDEELKCTILGCADGPASFNAELTNLGGNVTSIDMIYGFSKQQINSRIKEVAPEVYSKVKTNHQDFLWSYFSDPEDLLNKRLKTMETFISDFEEGLERGRYIEAKMPILPFPKDHFDLAVCSHFLFLYSEHLNLEFHIASILELARVASEIRIFPIIELNNAPSRHLKDVINQLEKFNLCCSIETVDYEFQRGGNQMLRIQHRLS